MGNAHVLFWLKMAGFKKSFLLRTTCRTTFVDPPYYIMCQFLMALRGGNYYFYHEPSRESKQYTVCVESVRTGHPSSLIEHFVMFTLRSIILKITLYVRFPIKQSYLKGLRYFGVNQDILRSTKIIWDRPRSFGIDQDHLWSSKII